MSETRLEIRPPRLLTGRVIVLLSFYGVLVSLPVVVAMLVVSVRQLSAGTILIPLAAAAVATFFLPLGFGNPVIARLARSLPPAQNPTAERFLVQLTLSPRLRSGWRAVLEDADDVGWLEVADSGLVFQGDSVTLALPWSRIGGLRLQTSGWRGLFAYGPRTILNGQAVEGVARIQFAERSSWIVPASRRNARRLYAAVARRAAPVPRGQSAGECRPGPCGDVPLSPKPAEVPRQGTR